MDQAPEPVSINLVIKFPVVLPVYQAIGCLFRWPKTNRRCYQKCLVSKERGIVELFRPEVPYTREGSRRSPSCRLLRGNTNLAPNFATPTTFLSLILSFVRGAFNLSSTPFLSVVSI